jgi:hypothetical protein
MESRVHPQMCIKIHPQRVPKALLLIPSHLQKEKHWNSPLQWFYISHLEKMLRLLALP